MILTCPNCGTSFNVPDGAIGAEGRKVKCANCGHMWHAMPSVAAPVHPQPAPASAVPQPQAPVAPQHAAPAAPQTAAAPQSAAQPAPVPQGAAPQGAAPQAASAPEPAAGASWPPETQQAAPSGPLAAALDDEEHDGLAPATASSAVAAPDATGSTDAESQPANEPDAEPAEEPTADADQGLPSSIDDIDLKLDDDEEDESEAPADSSDLGSKAAAVGSFMSRIAQGAAQAGLDKIAEIRSGTEGEDGGDAGAIQKTNRGKRFIAVFKDTRPSRIGWIMLVALWVGLFGTAIGYPEIVQQYWPKSKEIYDLIQKSSLTEQLKGNVEETSEPLGEREEKPGVLLTSATIDQAGSRPYLIVEGYVYNGGEGPTKVPAVQLQLLINRGNGFEIFDTYEFAPIDGIMTRATRVRFRECIANYPPGNLQMNAIIIERVGADGRALQPARSLEATCEDQPAN